MEAVIPFALASAPVLSGAAYVTGPTARGGKELPPLSTRGIELGTSREHLRVCGLARTTSATWGGGGGGRGTGGQESCCPPSLVFFLVA